MRLNMRNLCHYCLILPSLTVAFTTTQTRTNRAQPLRATSLGLPDSVFSTIDQGRIAILPDFLPPSQISRLRHDAQTLYSQNHFITDALAGYGRKAAQKDKSQFDASRDRSVLPAYIPSQKKQGPFVSELGDTDARKDLTRIIALLRSDLSIGLDRPGMDTPDGPNNHEISFTRFGPGAFLKRHQDEHHEELKGTKGWSTPTRRSLSWLVYLNEEWGDEDGGMLRTYPRIHTPSSPIGARGGDLQLGWLVPTLSDPYERPVFLDGRRGDTSGNCALYMDGREGERVYLTKNFMADPYLFLATDFVVQRLLISSKEYGTRFQYLEPPKNVLTEYFANAQKQRGLIVNRSGERVLDVAPTGGTLVLFDSVTLPHEVMATVGRERWAASGWFHEAQQEIPRAERRANQIFV